jgi:cytochrome o ubiquinol oxidase subunit 2
MKNCKLALFAFCSIAVLFLLSGCHLSVLDPKGLIAAKEVRLIIIATLLMLTIVVPVIIMTIWFAWRYRASNKDATYDPTFVHSTKIEILCWIIPCIIVGILAVITWFSSHELDPYKPLDSKVKPVTIQAISLDWKWVFFYPGEGVATINYVVIPKSTPINFQISSAGPMNALMIPQLAGQIYSMAGMRTKLHIISKHEGVYDGFSASFSGDGFSDMTFKTKVTDRATYDKWITEVGHSTRTMNMATYQHLVKPSELVPVTYYSHLEPRLFNKILMTYMMPSKAHTTQK